MSVFVELRQYAEDEDDTINLCIPVRVTIYILRPTYLTIHIWQPNTKGIRLRGRETVWDV